MYLVLMALLAMNVSKSILNAFIVVNEKFERAAHLTQGTTDGYMYKIDGQLATLRGTGAPKEEVDKLLAIQETAMKIRELARTTSNYYVWEASDMIAHSDPAMPTPFYHIEKEGDKEYYSLMEMDTLSKKDDYDTAPHLYLKEGTHETSEKGQAIEDRLFSFRDSIVQMAAEYTDDAGKKWFINPDVEIVRPEVKHDTVEFNASVREALKTVHEDDRDRIRRIIELLTVPKEVGNYTEMVPWIAYQFDHTVIVAAATIFTSLKNDVKMAEQIAIETVSSRAKVETFKFNKIEPLAFARTGYINQGDSLGLKIMIAAYDTSEAMKLEYWIDDSTRSSETMKTFTGDPGDELTLSGGVGSHFVTGTIAVKEKGIEKKKNWKFNYSVGAPNAAVAAADLAVLYRGWSNKIKVSASGYDPESIKVSCSGCSISKSGDFYIAKVSGSGKKATINVSATTDDGQTVKLAAEEFRIFPLPDPKPYFANQTYDKPTMKKSTAVGASQVFAKLGDSPLNISYKVTEFKMIVSKNGKIAELKSKSGKLSGEMKNAIKKMPKGTSLTIIGVKAAGPSGKSKPIGGLSFKLL